MSTANDYDFTPLTRRLPWAEVEAEYPGLRRDAVLGAAAVLASAAYWFWLFLGPKPNLPPEWSLVADAITILSLFVGVGAVAVVIIGMIMATIPFEMRRKLRVQQFASSNNFSYRAYGIEPPRVGQAFGGALRAQSVDQLTSVSGRNLRGRTGQKTVGIAIANALLYEQGNQNLPANSGSSRGSCGYVHVALTATSPHYLLDGLANNRPWQASVSARVRGRQRLSLEGDFDRYFSLYSPLGYERAALQIFTPDVMALLIDTGTRWDVEIIDNHLFVYSTRKFRLFDAHEMSRVLAFVDHVVPKLGGRIERIGPVDVPRRATSPSGTREAAGSRLAQSGAKVVLPFLTLLALIVGADVLLWMFATV